MIRTGIYDRLVRRPGFIFVTEIIRRNSAASHDQGEGCGGHTDVTGQ